MFSMNDVYDEEVFNDFMEFYNEEIDNYNKCLVKYPDNELLLSIKYLVPPHIARFNTKLSKKEQ